MILGYCLTLAQYKEDEKGEGGEDERLCSHRSHVVTVILIMVADF